MKDFFKRITAVFFAFTFIFLCACGRNNVESTTTASDITTSTTLPQLDDTEEDYDYPDPVDFDEYMSVNREVYAYILIPGTNIEYPIVQSESDDNYYLRINWKGYSDYRGSIYTQSVNSKDFTDPITVVYGHNTDKGDMFSELLNYKDKTFFDDNRLFYIFIPGHILVYKIFSANTFDDRHIMNSYDFTDPDVLYDFQQELLNPSALEKNSSSDVTLDENSEIVILETCAEPHSGGSLRFIVNGVLVKDVVTV